MDLLPSRRMSGPVHERRRRPPVALWSALATLGLALPGCSDAAPEGPDRGPPEARAARGRPGGPRLVVLVATCTLSKDFLSPYSPDVGYTPTLQQLGAAGVVFDAHYTEAGQSGTAYASLFSGAQADTHHVYTHPGLLDEELVLMAEAFAGSGWDTWYWHGHAMAAPKLGYAQGVPEERRVDFEQGDLEGPRLTRFDPQFVELLRGLASDPARRALITLTFSYTHGPYTVGRERRAFDLFQRMHPDQVTLSHEEMERWIGLWEAHRLPLQWNFAETRAALGLSDEDLAKIAEAIELAYKSGVHILDCHLGFLLQEVEEQGLQDELLLAFTADHGEVLYREDALFPWSHGLQLAPEVLHVPLVLFAPGLLRPGRYVGVTRSIDVYPTLAGLAGVEVPSTARVQGVDVSPALLGQSPGPELTAWFHSTTVSPHMFAEGAEYSRLHALFPTPGPESLWVGARRGGQLFRWRSLEDGTWVTEAFDAEPTQGARDVFDAARPEHAAMAEELRAYKRRLRAGFGELRAPDDALERLRELGYVGEDAGDEAEAR